MKWMVSFLTSALTCIGLSGHSMAEVVTVNPDTAHQMVLEGSAVLVDVRTPHEWRSTGVASNAKLLSLRDQDFEAKAASLLRGKPDARLAFICRTGGRSRTAASKLADFGLDTVFNVDEGMLGKQAGEGWIARQLPVIEYD